MGKVGEKTDVDFIISTGDNFYDSGLIDVDDPAFFESFSNVYTAPSLQKQWYSGKLIYTQGLIVIYLLIYFGILHLLISSSFKKLGCYYKAINYVSIYGYLF